MTLKRRNGNMLTTNNAVMPTIPWRGIVSGHAITAACGNRNHAEAVRRRALAQPLHDTAVAAFWRERLQHERLPARTRPTPSRRRGQVLAQTRAVRGQKCGRTSTASASAALRWQARDEMRASGVHAMPPGARPSHACWTPCRTLRHRSPDRYGTRWIHGARVNTIQCPSHLPTVADPSR